MLCFGIVGVFARADKILNRTLWCVEEVKYLRDRKSKMDIVGKMLVKLEIWRAECLYSRFRIVGNRSG